MIEHFAPDYSYDKLVTQLLRVVENPGKSPRSEIVSALAEIGHIAPARAQSDDDDPLTEADDAPHITVPVSTTMNDASILPLLVSGGTRTVFSMTST